MNETQPENLVRLGDLVLNRRVDELQIRQEQLAYGPSTSTMTKIEHEHVRVSALSYRKLEKSIGWGQGSCARVLAGGDPEVVNPSPPYRMLREDLFPSRGDGPETGPDDDGFYQPPEIPIPATGAGTRLGRYLETKNVPVAERSIEQHLFMSEYEGEIRRRAQGAERLAREEPLVDLVDLGQALAAHKNDEEVSDYVRRVESAVVGVMGVHRLTDALHWRAQERTIARANMEGLLDQLIVELDRIRQTGVDGRELQRRLDVWLDAALTQNVGGASSDDPEPGATGLQVDGVAAAGISELEVDSSDDDRDQAR